MWVGAAVCSPVAINVVSVADNVGRTTGLFANNVGRKWAVIVGPSESYCGPLHLDGKTNLRFLYHLRSSTMPRMRILNTVEQYDFDSPPDFNSLQRKKLSLAIWNGPLRHFHLFFRKSTSKNFHGI
jgi:hypothetical protein